jgi:hypothetical protein
MDCPAWKIDPAFIGQIKGALQWQFRVRLNWEFQCFNVEIKYMFFGNMENRPSKIHSETDA